jgi:hypothetical protein
VVILPISPRIIMPLAAAKSPVFWKEVLNISVSTNRATPRPRATITEKESTRSGSGL